MSKVNTKKLPPSISFDGEPGPKLDTLDEVTAGTEVKVKKRRKIGSAGDVPLVTAPPAADTFGDYSASEAEYILARHPLQPVPEFHPLQRLTRRRR